MDGAAQDRVQDCKCRLLDKAAGCRVQGWKFRILDRAVTGVLFNKMMGLL